MTLQCYNSYMICAKCKIDKPDDEFGLDASRRSGLYPYCKLCHIAHQKWMHEKKQKGIERRSYKINPETLQLAAKGLKKCSRCKIVRSFDEFSNNSWARDGKFTRCKICKSIEAKGQYDRNERKRDTQLFELYRISLDDYNEMIADQGGRCLICNRVSNHRLCVDHDHGCCSGKNSCGKCIRGLLCKTCNLAIGNLNDDPVLLLKAAEYISLWNNRLR